MVLWLYLRACVHQMSFFTLAAFFSTNSVMFSVDIQYLSITLCLQPFLPRCSGRFQSKTVKLLEHHRAHQCHYSLIAIKYISEEKRILSFTDIPVIHNLTLGYHDQYLQPARFLSIGLADLCGVNKDVHSGNNKGLKKTLGQCSQNGAVGTGSAKTHLVDTGPY